MKILHKPIRFWRAIVATILLVFTFSMTLWAQSPGGCSYSEGQFLFTTSWGESVYAHYYNGSLFAAYQDGTDFKPQHWLVATGQMSSSTASCFAENDPHTTTPTQNPNPNPNPTGNCPYTEGQFLFTTSWGESVYAHYYNGTLFAAYQDGSNFKPQHWLVATGQMSSSTASCFAENDPHTTTPTQNPNPNPNPTGNCPYSEGQYLFTFNTEVMYAHYYNGVLYAAYQDGTGFKPQHWLVATGLMSSSMASCFAENDPHSSTPTQNPNPNPTTSPAQAGSNFAGNLDGADCSGIGGWVVNKNKPYQSTKFDVYVNGWLVGVGIPATNSRQDVANALGISGYNAFGFYVPLPGRYKTGSAMTISVKYSGTQTDIPGSPKTTVACPVNPLGCSNDGSGRLAQTESTTYSRTDGVSMKLSGGGSSVVSSLTSKLIPVRKGDQFSLDAYAYAPIRPKTNLAPQITTAVVGGVLAGAALTQQQTSTPDQSNRSIQTAPTLGVSTALMIPLVKSLLAKHIPDARVDVAFYDQQGKFIHRQQVGITKAAREDWQLLHIQGDAQQAGYITVRLQNPSKTPVWFDDVSFQTVPLPRSSSVNKGLFVPKTTTSTSGFAPQQPINTESLYRNCTTEDPNVKDGLLNVDATVVGQGNDSSLKWGWISGPESGSITGPGPGNPGGGSSGGGGSSSTATFVPYNAPIDSVATGLSTTGRLVKGQIYTSPTGAIYIWDGKSWSIPVAEAEVKGQRPTNPANEQLYFYTDPNFGYTTVYEYISGHWTMPLNSQTPSSIKTEKENLNPCNEKVYDKLVNADGVLRSTVLGILYKFHTSNDLTLVIADENIGPYGDDAIAGAANADKSVWNITLNTTALQNATQEYIAATIIHEVLHVYLGTSNNDLDHNTMAEKYVYPMATALRAAGFTISYENAVALCWGGLYASRAWTELVNIDKVSNTQVTKRIKDTNEAYKSGGQGLGCNF